MRRHIYYFIAASFAVHAAAVLIVLTPISTRKYIVPASASSAPAFTVALLPPQPTQNPQAHRRHKPQPLRHVYRTHAVAPAPARHPAPDLRGQKTDQHSVAQADRQAELRRRQVRDRVLSRLQVNLRRYISYPPLARRQGWQGRVLLGFSIEADGKIRNIHVAAGSGYAVLDDSAVAALTELQRLQPTDTWPGQRLDLQLPVIYRLQGG